MEEEEGPVAKAAAAEEEEEEEEEEESGAEADVDDDLEEGCFFTETVEPSFWFFDFLSVSFCGFFRLVMLSLQRVARATWKKIISCGSIFVLNGWVDLFSKKRKAKDQIIIIFLIS